MRQILIVVGLVWLVCSHAAGQEQRKPAIPELIKRDVSREGVEYLQRLRKNTPFGTNNFDLNALRAGMGTRREPTIKDVKLIKVKIGEIPGEWVVAGGADADVRLLYLHGGGFVSGSGAFYLAQAAHISAAAKCAVLLPDYRLAPEHPFPAGLDDCVLAHQWMIANGPAGQGPARATFVAGDSAGGSLTLATLLALRDRKMTLPAGGIALSPTTDLTLASESLKTVSDPIISAKTMPVFRDHYLGKTDPRNPLASPVFGDYRGLPPLLIQAGEHEMLRDDSIRIAKKARADGIPVRLEIWPGMFHVFQSHEPLLPEAREAIEHMAEFMRSALLTKRNIPYVEKAHELQMLDVSAPKNAKNLPVVFWIHGGGWQVGDKSEVHVKPHVFMDKGFVFVSTNYRLLPSVDMATIVRDVAKSIRWVHDHIAEYGGDPKRLLVMGHSAGAQLAALVCTDDRYLKAEGLSLSIIKGCVPVDGDTFDVPAIIATAEARWKAHDLPRAKFGHREKFGNDPEKHRDFSAVTHVAKDKGIPPFLILHVAGHPDTTAQAQRLGNVLKAASVPATVFAARESTHSKINADLGLPDDPATKALFEFVAGALKEPIPDKLVVLTFDDSAKSHYTVARPLLMKYKFGATFFITEGFDFPTNKKDYMTWDEIVQLHKDGFEIGNHTLDHKALTGKTLADLPAQLRGISAQCKKHGIPPPTSFAYPGNAFVKEALPVLRDNGITFARRGGSPEFPYKEGRGFAYEPGLDHALLVPSAGDARPAWTLDNFKAAVAQAKQGKIAVLQFHGVPDTAHDWVNSTKEQFESYMKYLADNKFTVIAMRDLAKFVDPAKNPNDPLGVIEDRKKRIKAKEDGNRR